MIDLRKNAFCLCFMNVNKSRSHTGREAQRRAMSRLDQHCFESLLGAAGVRTLIENNVFKF